MTDNIKYCWCGQLLIKQETKCHNQVTGEKIFIDACPTGKCGHYTTIGDIQHKWKYPWSFLFGEITCEKCGEVDYD